MRGQHGLDRSPLLEELLPRLVLAGGIGHSRATAHCSRRAASAPARRTPPGGSPTAAAPAPACAVLGARVRDVSWTRLTGRSSARSSSAHSRGMPTISSPDGSSSMYGLQETSRFREASTQGRRAGRSHRQLEQLASPRLSCSSRPRARSAEWSSLGTTLATAAPTGPAATDAGVRCSAVGMESSVSPCATPSGPATRQTPQPGSFAGSTASLAMPLSDSQARKEASSGGAAAGAAEATVPRACRAETAATKWRGASRLYASAAVESR